MVPEPDARNLSLISTVLFSPWSIICNGILDLVLGPVMISAPNAVFSQATAAWRPDLFYVWLLYESLKGSFNDTVTPRP
jgi:hypothetical protein